MENKKLLTWHDSFSVKNALIDSQHKKWIDIINLFYSAYQSGLSDKKVEETLIELKAYTKYHFSTEEKLFEVHNYEQSEEHIEAHHKFILKLEEISLKFKVDKKNINLELMTFIRTWLISHIMDTDKQYVGKI